MSIIEVTLKSGTYPASTQGSRVARCYVCNEIRDKVKMTEIGSAILPKDTEDEEEPRAYIYRCNDCTVGSEKWIKHFMSRSSLRMLYMGLEGKRLSMDERKAIGGIIVEKTKEKYEREICDRLDQKKVGRSSCKDTSGEDTAAATATGEGSQVTTSEKVEGRLSGRRRKRSWRAVTIRRGR